MTMVFFWFPVVIGGGWVFWRVCKAHTDAQRSAEYDNRARTLIGQLQSGALQSVVVTDLYGHLRLKEPIRAMYAGGIGDGGERFSLKVFGSKMVLEGCEELSEYIQVALALQSREWDVVVRKAAELAEKIPELRVKYQSRQCRIEIWRLPEPVEYDQTWAASRPRPNLRLVS